MTTHNQSGFMQRVRASITRGVLFIVPFAVTWFVVGLVAGMADGWLGPLLAAIVRAVVPASWLTGPFEGGHIPGLSLLVFIALLYAVGRFASWHVGRRGLRLIDHLFQAIPGVRFIYSAARKVVDAVGDTTQATFQRAVLVNWGHTDTKTIGFVTNEIVDRTSGRKYLVLFIPTPPNPASGFVVWVSEEEATDPGISMEEALKVVLSLGVLTPKEINVTRPTPPTGGAEGTGSGHLHS